MSPTPTPPSLGDFTPRERRIIRSLRTPRRVQEYLRRIPYNWEKSGPTLRSFHGVVRHGEAHCLEAALFATAVMEQHGHPPLLLDLESQDGLDHTLFLYRRRGKYGTVGRSRDAGLHGRKPVYATVRRLALSYADPFVDWTGRLTGYAVFDLRDLSRCDWRLSDRNVWAVERALLRIPHVRVRTSDRKHRILHERFLDFKRRHPDRPVTYYSSRPHWL